MAGLFMCLGFPLGLLGFDLGIPGFDLGSQSWLPSLPLIPSELLLGFHLGSLCFRLSSIWDSILASFASI